eukprot:scaffold30748_cov43-Prasinocladus_malaysianus.AAC.3
MGILPVIVSYKERPPSDAQAGLRAAHLLTLSRCISACIRYVSRDSTPPLLLQGSSRDPELSRGRRSLWEDKSEN